MILNCRVITVLIGAFLLVTAFGCGTTKWSDTSRTATEQLLITSAMDEVIDAIDFYPLTGRKVYIESGGVAATDKEYLLSILRQQLSANGVFLQNEKAEADYILEVATGAVGTNRYDLMYGIPETTVPSIAGVAATSIPEVPFIKRTDQKAQVKLVMWAYNQKTGAIIWQSGEKRQTSWIRDRWFFGAGPITKSTFDQNAQFNGSDVHYDLFDQRVARDEKPSVRTEAVYRELDADAISELETIRKEGFAAMTKKSEPTQEEEALAQESPEAKSAEEAVSKENPATQPESVVPEAPKEEKVASEPVKVAQQPATSTPASTKSSTGSSKTTSPSRSTPVPARKVVSEPLLDLGDVQLPAGTPVRRK